MRQPRWCRLVPAVLVVLVAACTAGPPPAPSADPHAACLQQLDQRHLAFERIEDFRTPEGCGIDGAVRLRQGVLAWNRPGLMTCAMAERVTAFETEVVQPAASRYFGRRVTKMVNAGTYDCRGVRGNHPERMSDHAFGRAIDVIGFELEDGTKVSVLRDWRSKGAKGEFLHKVGTDACRIFNVVITPDSNALHRDHLHLDIGRYRFCGR